MKWKQFTKKISVLSISALVLVMLADISGFSKPKISGSVDTSAYTYSTVKEDFSGTDTNYKLYESILLDVKFNDKLSIHTSDRIAYRGLEIEKDANEDPEKLDLNIYYGYVNYKLNNKLNFQVGRIMGINNLVYTYFDGLNVNFRTMVKENKLTFDLYGGLLINDDYLEDEKDPDNINGFNSFDVRNFYIEQRVGDYIAGVKTNLYAKKIGMFSLDYQMTMNESKVAEQYVSIDFDTTFSKKIKAYGFGSFDLIEKTPSNTLAGVRGMFIKWISFAVEHEYYRPVFIKDSFFWKYFEPLGHQAINGIVMFFFSPIMTLDLKYSRLIYDSENGQGNEADATFEIRDILGFGIMVNGNYLSGPEGDKMTGIGIVKRRFFNLIDISGGGGVVYFEEDTVTGTMAKAYVARAGLGLRLFNKLIISGDFEYFNNPKYLYDIRSLISVKYIF